MTLFSRSPWSCLTKCFPTPYLMNSEQTWLIVKLGWVNNFINFWYIINMEKTGDWFWWPWPYFQGHLGQIWPNACLPPISWIQTKSVWLYYWDGKKAWLTFDTSLVWRKQVIDFGDHDPIFKVTFVMFDELICPLSLEFRTNLVDCIIGMGKRLD